MTDYLECSDNDCIKEWKDNEFDKWCKEEEEEKIGLVPQHCSTFGCHEIYIKGKHGHTCAGCGRDICRLCFEDGLCVIDECEETWCNKCNIENNKN